MRSPLSKLLVVVNGSESSIGAARYAISLAKAYRCSICAVYVVDTATIRQLAISRIFVPDESKEYESSLEGSGRRLLGYVSELAEADGLKAETVMRKGAIPAEVIGLAEEIGADCIVIGETERKSAFKDALMDVYMEIASNSPCPVLVVRGKHAAGPFQES
jgi:nucleotide-binding universal stress UspA family protein